MPNKEHQDSFILSLFHLFQGLTKMGLEIFDLAVVEMGVAKQSLVTICMLTIVLIFLFVSLWTSLMVMMVYGLMALGLNIFLSLLAIAGLNLLLAIIILMVIMKFRKKLKLPETRKQLTFKRKKHDDVLE